MNLKVNKEENREGSGGRKNNVIIYNAPQQNK